MNLNFEKKPSYDDLYAVFLQMAAYYGAGTSLFSSFDPLIAQTENVMLKEALKTIKKDVLEGKPYSVAFAKHKKIFPDFVVQAIYAGEEAGTLDKSFEHIAFHLEQLCEIQNRISSAILPVKIIGSLISVAIAIMLTVVIPKFEQLYSELNITLPLFTRIVVGILGFLVHYWYLHLIIGIGVWYAFLKYSQDEKNQEKLDKLLFHVPIYKWVYYYFVQYRIVRIFKLLRSSGMNSADALKITGDAIGNKVVSETFKKAAKDMRDGIPIAQAISQNNKHKVVDFLIINFMDTGEETGLPTELLDRAARYYYNLLQKKIRDFSEKIGPAFLAPIGILLIIVIVAVYYPIFTITSAIK